MQEKEKANKPSAPGASGDCPETKPESQQAPISNVHPAFSIALAGIVRLHGGRK